MVRVKKCENCGQVITDEEDEANGGLCDVCQWEEEDDDFLLGM